MYTYYVKPHNQPEGRDSGPVLQVVMHREVNKQLGLCVYYYPHITEKGTKAQVSVQGVNTHTVRLLNPVNVF